MDGTQGRWSTCSPTPGPMPGTAPSTEQRRNAALDTLSNTQKAFEGLTKVPHYNEEFAGGTIGGPLKKDREFVFGGFSQQLDTGVRGVLATGNLTPTPVGLAQLAACYPGSTSVAALQKYGPYGVGGGNPQPSGAPETVLLTGPRLRMARAAVRTRL
jgi:hypothetical protein